MYMKICDECDFKCEYESNLQKCPKCNSPLFYTLAGIPPWPDKIVTRVYECDPQSGEPVKGGMTTETRVSLVENPELPHQRTHEKVEYRTYKIGDKPPEWDEVE